MDSQEAEEQLSYLEKDSFWIREQAIALDNALSNHNLTKKELVQLLRQGEELLSRARISLRENIKFVENEEKQNPE